MLYFRVTKHGFSQFHWLIGILSGFIWHYNWLGPSDFSLNNVTFEFPVDAPEYTKCCRLGYAPHCCEERADHVCASRGGSKKSGGDYGKKPWQIGVGGREFSAKILSNRIPKVILLVFRVCSGTLNSNYYRSGSRIPLRRGAGGIPLLDPPLINLKMWRHYGISIDLF